MAESYHIAVHNQVQPNFRLHLVIDDWFYNNGQPPAGHIVAAGLKVLSEGDRYFSRSATKFLCCSGFTGFIGEGDRTGKGLGRIVSERPIRS